MTYIYHITHIDNLREMLQVGGLYSDNERIRKGFDPISIAHDHIKQRRARKMVRIQPGGTVADYVPFYFAPRSPMLYAIHRGTVEDYKGGQNSVLHLVSTAEDVARQQSQFVFTDGHADMALSQFFDDLRALDRIDWRV
ncbi:MAG: DUF4433 domain-containing protein, partial [bacterium]